MKVRLCMLYIVKCPMWTVGIYAVCTFAAIPTLTFNRKYENLGLCVRTCVYIYIYVYRNKRFSFFY